MSTTATPTGAEPVGTLSASGSFSGKVRHIKIASGYAANVFYGDFVKIVSAGTVERAVITTGLVAGIVGVFLGCRYTDPTSKQPTFAQYWPTGTVASDAVAIVADDPNLLFKMQGDGSIAQTGLGNNVQVINTAGSTVTGRSKIALDASSIATTNTYQIRIVDFVDGPDSSAGDTYTDVICMISPTTHAYSTLTGV